MSANPFLCRTESGCMLIACVIHTCIILLPQSVVFPLVSSQVILDDSNFRVDTITCPGDQIIFYCTVNRSQTLSWSSNEYIGSNGAQLEFSSGDSIGTIITSRVDSSVFANLTNVRNGNFLQSMLHLTSNQNSTVSCLTIIAGSRKSISFTVLRQDPPGTPENAAAVEIPSKSDECVLLVTWNPPENVDEKTIRYIVRTSRAVDLPPIINETSTLASFLSPCEDIKGITINVTAVDICGNIGGTTANFKPSFANVVTSNATTSTSTTEPLPPDPQVSNSMVVAITIAVLASVLAVIIALVSFVTVICCNFHRRFTKVQDKSERTPLTKMMKVSQRSTAMSSIDSKEAMVLFRSRRKSF